MTQMRLPLGNEAGYRNEDDRLPRDENGFPVYCTPDRLCATCTAAQVPPKPATPTDDDLHTKIAARRHRRAADRAALAKLPAYDPTPPSGKPKLPWRGISPSNAPRRLRGR